MTFCLLCVFRLKEGDVEAAAGDQTQKDVRLNSWNKNHHVYMDSLKLEILHSSPADQVIQQQDKQREQISNTS